MDKSALICDMAETYHIYDIMRMPARVVGVLASGLREDSRIIQKISGINTNVDTLLLAKILDCFNVWLWSHTKDGEKNRNRPKSYAEQIASGPKEPETEVFTTPDDFEARRAEILKKIQKEKQHG